MPLEVVTPATTTEVVAKFLEILKARLDIPKEETWKDAELRDRILDAIQLVESYLWRPLFSTVYKLWVPGQFGVWLPKPPCISVDSVKYYNEDGDLTTLDAEEDYFTEIKAEPAYVGYRDGVSLTFEEFRVYPVEITFTAGYGTLITHLPPNIKEAVLVTAYAAFQYPDQCHGGLPKAAEARCLQHFFRDQRTVCHL